MNKSLENLELTWTEKDLPQKERTKHVHGLHPYLGKFIPQLPEIFLNIYFKPGDTILDPFMGSGTTLVEANSLDMNSVGVDISFFNCLMTKVKTDKYELLKLKFEINDAFAKLVDFLGSQSTLSNKLFNNYMEEEFCYTSNEYINLWFSQRSVKELLCYKNIIEKGEYEYKDVLKIILSKSARSARQVPHYELDWATEPVKEPYYCYKHRRTCFPTNEAFKFIRRYSNEVLNRITEFSKVRKNREVCIIHGDSRVVDLGKEIDGIFTSPPYCGLIDYHAQHEYIYQLLNLKDLREKEIGPKVKGKNAQSREEYKAGISTVFENCNKFLKPDGRVIIVVNDQLNLYPEIIERSGLVEEDRVSRGVDRRTGRRATGFTEDIIICKKA